MEFLGITLKGVDSMSSDTNNKERKPTTGGWTSTQTNAHGSRRVNNPLEIEG